MSTTITDDLTRYYDEVRTYMDCPEDEQNRLLSEINQAALELQADGMELDYDKLVGFFGKAEELAAILMPRVNPVKLRRYELKKKFINARKYFVAAIVIVGILLSLGYTTYSKENTVYTVHKDVSITDLD